MSAGQRLRNIFEARRADRLCWRCALGRGNGPVYLSTLVKDVLPTRGGSRLKAQCTSKDKYDGSLFHRSPTGRAGLVESLRLRYKFLGSPSQASRQYATAAPETSRPTPHLDPSIMGAEAKLKSSLDEGNIREHLRLWQEQQDLNLNLTNAAQSSPFSKIKDGQNLFTQSGEDESFTMITREIEAEEVEDDDYVEFGSDDPTPDVLKNELFLRRGDLVELPAGTDVILAIFVRNLADQCQFYTMRGEWLHRKSGRARFSVPHFVHPDELKDILPYLPTEEVSKDMIDRLQPLNVSAPRDAGSKLLEKMALFHEAADNIFRKHADRLNRTYELIAPSKPSAGRTAMNLGQIAMTVLQIKDKAELTPVMMWAVHRAVTQSQNITRDAINYRQNVMYEIHPQRSLAEISQVRDWVRDYQEDIIEQATEAFDGNPAEMKLVRSENPIATFVTKARSAVEQSRRTRVLSANGCLGPSSVKVAPVQPDLKTYKVTSLQKFSEDERVIIHYIDAWVTSRYLNPATNLSALGPMILRAVGMYESFKLDQTIGFTFLQELGIIAPWENRAIYSLINLRLPGHDQDSETTRLQYIAYRESGRIRTLESPKDSMEGMRKDWADLPVFCIDSADTLERDDGVSLEPVDGNDSEYWLHVHVANPSAFITPNSATGKYAAQLSESVYFPERKYPMISPALTAKHLSLADGRPCLTFSARMTTGGDILESKITPGTVHDVHYLTPHSVGQELGINDLEEPEAISLVTVGGEIPVLPKQEAKESRKPLSASHITMLRRLLEIGEAARLRRTRNGAPDFYSSARIIDTYPQVFLGARVAPFELNDGAITRYDGDPIISIERTTAGYGLVAKMVSDLMILAGEVSASWCSERNIPIPYRGIMRNPEPPTSPELFREEIINPKVKKYGHANQWDLVRYMRLLGQAAVSASPLEHFALGLPAYCKATSPLRRYIDMYTHWQIEAALRHEAATGKSLIGNTDDSYLPFSRAAVEEYASTALQRERKISSAKTGSTKHWITHALFRAFYFKEAPLPETFVVRTHLRYDTRQQGWLTEWGIGVELADNAASEREGGFKVGDMWEAKIAIINPYYKAIEMEPVRLLEREESEAVDR